MENDPKVLVSTDWLSSRLSDPEIRILDATWYLPNVDRDAKAEYDQSHIPNARFFDIDDVSDHRSDLPHMVPPVEKFMSKVRKLGVGDGHQIVIYDSHGLFSAARVWWLFKVMGQKNVAVLDGGLPKWLREGRTVDSSSPLIRDRHMFVKYHDEMVKDVTQVSSASKLGDFEILDARSAGRFRGEEPEPRPGLRAGHIPGSKNIFYGDLLNEDGTLKSQDKLVEHFKAKAVNLDKPVITSCGSGVTAAIINLALDRIGKTDHALYDGSWTEWGMYPTVPVETGDN
jgi:thiosulfate/3-mercaptopyruvate sulfurtransferase